ncbi:uncharacterized protein LOC111496685 isoform X2 [Cucurbita maxima]|uniref:Uncharacterized protein LOC111496685 isoform X2 n=1 Tax=Cucurbita maxima TaxID=3661 RepID=A0A6J1KQC0_CUCMA|nr:uncharacterized protein LOC111496685 isoform X2 [Cucurbita maxima]
MSSAPGFKVVIAEDPVSRLTRAQLMQSSLLVGWSYGRAKQIYSDNEKNLSPRLHLVSAAEAGALVCFLHKSSLACENKNAASESSSSSATLFWAIWFLMVHLQFMKNSVHLLPTRGLMDQSEFSKFWGITEFS